MNWLLIVSGLFAAFTTVGHFVIGSKRFLIPMLEASFDGVARKQMHSVFHYVSVDLVVSTVLLLAVGFGVDLGSGASLVVKFVALHYALYAVVQILVALTSGLDGAFLKLFQWVLFALIAVLGWFGRVALARELGTAARSHAEP